MLSILENPEEEYIVFKEDNIQKNPQMFIVPQNYPEDIYVKTKKELPFIVKLFAGGLSIVGLYMVYRLMEKSRKK